MAHDVELAAHEDWPALGHDAAALAPLERRFLLHVGEFIGAVRHIGESGNDALKIELLRDEAPKTSEIEGEILDRTSVQASLLPRPSVALRSVGLHIIADTSGVNVGSAGAD